MQIGSGGVVVTGDKLLAGDISQQAVDLRTMEAAPARATSCGIQWESGSQNWLLESGR